VTEQPGLTYRSAGVDIGAGEEAVRRIAGHVETTRRPEVLGGLGGFGGLFAFEASRYDDPVFVSSTDGVGTKAMVATLAGRFDTIGIDLVAMCVDDIACQGAEPLWFLDYISVGRLDPDQVDELVAGVAAGCREAGCALIGGEMAEHPGAMKPGDFDLVGFAVGVVDRRRLITPAAMEAGDVVIALPSPGLRSNGYSLARQVLLDGGAGRLDDPAWSGAPHTLGDELLRPSVIYAPTIRALVQELDVHGVAHITGGGLPGNVPRMLPRDLDVVMRRSAWQVPPIFEEIARRGPVARDEMERVFNLGVGMVIAIRREDAEAALRLAADHGHAAVVVGEVVRGTGQLTLLD
jgi:phosphoribosylformylglycinamidine cyclo-ligase